MYWLRGKRQFSYGVDMKWLSRIVLGRQVSERSIRSSRVSARTLWLTSAAILVIVAGWGIFRARVSMDTSLIGQQLSVGNFKVVVSYRLLYGYPKTQSIVGATTLEMELSNPADSPDNGNLAIVSAGSGFCEDVDLACSFAQSHKVMPLLWFIDRSDVYIIKRLSGGQFEVLDKASVTAIQIVETKMQTKVP